MSLTVVVTGANQGAGFEACRQLALDSRVSKVVLTCRSEAKAKAAIDALKKATGKPPELFDFVLLDLDDHASALAAVGALPAKVDVLILNAGYLGPGLRPDGAVTATFASTVGHATLTEGLLACRKVAPGARVVYSSTELTRWVPMMTDFQA